VGKAKIVLKKCIFEKKEVPLATLPLPAVRIAYFQGYRKPRDTLLIEQHDRWQKASYRNRTTHRFNANGLQTLSIPCSWVAEGKKDKLQRSANLLCRELATPALAEYRISAYHSAPFFEHYAPYFEPLYIKETTLLFDFNLALFKLLLRFCKLELALSFTDEYQTEITTNQDLRTPFLQQLTIENTSSYHQVFEAKHGFLSNVSVLDLLFNEGPVAGEYLKLS
jgi:hypothetical protein